ncbi:MAG: flippase-like domain-containing protein [Actinomycetota bacterium]|nr:flippase-like domain-containing protein [Actinomycetota bacterium]
MPGGATVGRWKTTMPALRVAATAVMLVWLARHVHLSQLHRPTWRPATLLWVGAALAVTAVGILLSAVRWQRVLVALGLPARTPTLVRHYLASLFVGNFLPSTIGGDVLRASRLAAANGEAPATVASVVLERLTGWLVLPVLAVFALFVNPGLRRVAPGPAGTALTISVATLVLLGVLLALAASSRPGRLLPGSEAWRRFTSAVHLGLRRVRNHPGLAFEILTVGFAYQLAMVLSAFLAAKALGLAVGWTAILAFFPVVAMIQVIPVTFSGLGTREAALVFFLHPLGVPQADAFALGLLVYFITLAVSLLGAPAFAVGGRPARAVA